MAVAAGAAGAARLTWFPGHMVRATRQIKEQLSKVDMVIEVRDARIPLSSINDQLEAMAQRRRRTLVLNKADLADASLAPAVAAHLAAREAAATGASGPEPHQPLFTACPAGGHASRAGRELLASLKARLRAECPHADTLLLMLVGVPNCGKSSLVNALRAAAGAARPVPLRGAVAVVGPTPGLTRRVSSFRLMDSPSTHVLDTPGVMVPRIRDFATGLRLALTGAIRDSVVGEERLARYLLHTLARGPPTGRRIDADNVAAVMQEGLAFGGDGRPGPDDDEEEVADEAASSSGRPIAAGPADAAALLWADVGLGADWAALRDAALALPSIRALPRAQRLIERLGTPGGARGPADVSSAVGLLDLFRAGQLGRVTLDRIPRPGEEGYHQPIGVAGKGGAAREAVQ